MATADGTRGERNESLTFVFDGKKVAAVEGESVASALVAAGNLAFARSPKFHRPRGPSCMRAACDGCLARVDDVPNVMTCRERVREGMVVDSQNTLGARDLDLLRMTDWFFPDGLNHHELFAGVPGVQTVMQVFARRVAGLGKLPASVVLPKAAKRIEVDVLVVGSGPSGMLAATKLAAAGRGVVVVDDAFERGGTLAALPLGRVEWTEVIERFDECVAAKSITFQAMTTAAAFYGDDVLVIGPEGASVVTARAVVVASGAHDGVVAFEGNDLPGVLSARAALFLLRNDALPFRRVVVVEVDGGTCLGPIAVEALARSGGRGAKREVQHVRGTPLRASGISRVKRLRVRTESGERDLDVDGVVLDAPGAPSYELLSQVGAELAHERRGFVVHTDAGRVAEGVYATGEVAGVALEKAALEEHAAMTVASVVAQRG